MKRKTSDSYSLLFFCEVFSRRESRRESVRLSASPCSLAPPEDFTEGKEGSKDQKFILSWMRTDLVIKPA
jgi:hypothetical protein